MARRSVEVRYEAIMSRYDGPVVASSALTRRFAKDVEHADGRLVLFGRDADRTGSQIDRFSGRVRILADAIAALGPAVAPVGAVAVPAIAGLASAVGFAAVGAGTMALAFQGMGDVLDAVNKARLEPTAENLQAARDAMATLSPEARRFVRQLQDMIPAVKELRDASAGGLLPGWTEGLEDLETALPRVRRVVSAIATELGGIGADVGGSIASGRWDNFLDFLAEEGPSALAQTASAAGNLTHGLAELWMAFDPASDDFLTWLNRTSHEFDVWAQNLDNTEGFEEFLTFIRDNGPQVAATAGAIGAAFVEIVEATAPLGGPVLNVLEKLANVIAAIADSPLGTPLAAIAVSMGAVNTATRVYAATQRAAFGSPAVSRLRAMGAALTTVTTAQQRATMSAEALAVAEKRRTDAIRGGMSMIGRNALLLGGLAAVSTGAADKIGLTNTATLGLLGTLGGPWGVAVGLATGATLDFVGALDQLSDVQHKTRDQAHAAASSGDLDQIGDAIANTREQLAQLKKSDGNWVNEVFGDKLRQSGISNMERDLYRLEAAQRVATETAKWDALLDNINLTREGLDVASQSAEDFRDTLLEVQELLGRRSAFRDYQQALLDFAERGERRSEVLAEIARVRDESAVDVSRAQADLADADTASERRNARERIADIRAQAAERIKALREEADALKYSLDVGTQAGIDTQADLDAIEAGVIKYIATLADPRLRARFLDHARDQFLQAANAAGISKKRAEELADQYYLLDTIEASPEVTVDTTKAHRELTTLGVFLNDFTRDRSIRIHAYLDNAGAAGDIGDLLLQTVPTPKSNARGGLYPAYATGDIANRHMPELAGPGPTRIWREPETRGEAYIPLANDFRRPRAVDIWHKTGVALGVQFQRYAYGGMIQQSGGTVSIDYDRLARAMASVRPLAGQITMMPHDYNEFRRQELEYRRMAAVGGTPE